VCEDDYKLSIADSQAQILSDARMHSAKLMFEMRVGPTLTMMILSCWFMIYLNELHQGFTLMRALHHIPRGKRSHLRAFNNKWKHWQLTKLAPSRALMVICINLIRAGLATALLIQGSLWLLYTVELSEMVLNATALGFIFDVDDMAYRAFVPKGPKSILSKILPLPLHRTRLPPLTGLTFVIYVAVIYFGYVLPQADHVEDLVEVLCGGRKDFALLWYHDLNIVYSTDTRPLNEGNAAIVNAFRELRTSTPNPSESEYVADLRLAQAFATMVPSLVGDATRETCGDTTPSDFPVYWRKLQSLHGDTSATSCSACICHDMSSHVLKR
jgi:hypothetical protein